MFNEQSSQPPKQYTVKSSSDKPAPPPLPQHADTVPWLLYSIGAFVLAFFVGAAWNGSNQASILVAIYIYATLFTPYTIGFAVFYFINKRPQHRWSLSIFFFGLSLSVITAAILHFVDNNPPFSVGLVFGAAFAWVLKKRSDKIKQYATSSVIERVASSSDEELADGALLHSKNQVEGAHDGSLSKHAGEIKSLGKRNIIIIAVFIVLAAVVVGWLVMLGLHSNAEGASTGQASSTSDSNSADVLSSNAASSASLPPMAAAQQGKSTSDIQHSSDRDVARPPRSGVPEKSEIASEVFQQASPSVVEVLTYNNTGKVSEFGSGVKLADGNVATNCHVLEDGATYRVRYLGKLYVAQLDEADWEHDVCALSVPDLPAPPVVLGDTRTLQIGAPVYAIGTPEGLQLTLSEGIVSSLRQVSGGSYIQTTAAVSPGSSGGGLFDTQGRLLGLTSFSTKEGQQLNFALPVEWIEALPNHMASRAVSSEIDAQWLNKAEEMEDKKDWQGLISFSKARVKAKPDDEYAWFALGEAYTQSNKQENGMAATLRGLQIDPNNANAWYTLCNAYSENGSYSQAIEACHRALKINPSYADAWSVLGNAYAYTHQDAQAIDAYHRALRVNPKDVGALTNLGNEYEGSGQFVFAISFYRMALKIDPEDVTTWYDLGIAYNQNDQSAQALDVYQRLRTLSPDLAKKLRDTIGPG